MGSELESALISAIVGGLVAIAIFFAQREQNRWQATMAIIAEFNSLPWLTIRSGAYEALRKYPDPSLTMIRHMKDHPLDPSLSNEERDKIWAILTFYARLYLMLDGNFLVKRTILPAFGEVFFWWWEFQFVHIKDASHHSELKLVKLLHNWLERQAVASNNPGMLAPWRKEGLDSRKQLLRPDAA